MFPPPAFEIKTFGSPLAMLELYSRLRQYVDRERQARRWWNSRAVRTTLSVRQMHQRLQLRRTRVQLRHVCLDLVPTTVPAARPVRH